MSEMKLQVRLMENTTVATFKSMLKTLDVDPPYQREGNIWTLEAKRRLIDSMINGFDVPKFYLEKLRNQRRGPYGFKIRHAVIDGKQRTEAIAEFLENRLHLSTDFIYFEEGGVNAAGMNYQQLASEYPKLAGRFMSYPLSLVEVDSTSGDLIEEMFLRLNNSSALNAAEKRNAISGPVKDATVELAEHKFFLGKSPIRNARYKYRELASKFLLLEYQFDKAGRVENTKANTLLDFFQKSAGRDPELNSGTVGVYRDRVAVILDQMCNTFEDDDKLLSSIGTVVVYYLLFRDRKTCSARLDEASGLRDVLRSFEDERRLVRRDEDGDLAVDSEVNRMFAEYNSLVQSTNDGRALMRRMEIISEYISSAAG